MCIDKSIVPWSHTLPQHLPGADESSQERTHTLYRDKVSFIWILVTWHTFTHMTKWCETAVASQVGIIKLASEVRSAVHDLWLVFAINLNHKVGGAQNASSSSANYYFLRGSVCADKRWYDITLHTLAPSPCIESHMCLRLHSRGGIFIVGQHKVHRCVMKRTHPHDSFSVQERTEDNGRA